MAYITVTNSFTNGAGNIIDATEVNQNFTDLVNGTSDGTKDFNIGSVVNIAGTFIFNEAGADKDFRCEGDSDQNLLYLDAGNDRMGVGISAPDTKQHVHKATAGAVSAVANSVLTVENSTHAHISILTPAVSAGALVYGSPTSNYRSAICYDHSIDKLWIMTAGGPLPSFYFTSTSFGVGIDSPDSLCHLWASTAGAVTASADSLLTVERNGAASISILTPATSSGILYFGSPTSATRAAIGYAHDLDKFSIITADAVGIVTIDGVGAMGINESSPASAIDIDKDGGGANKGYITIAEIAADAGAPAANHCVIYAVDNGAGKTVLRARFNSGAVQQIAIEP